MYAFSRHTANREVLIEKINNINSIEEYNFKHYDTVEVSYYTKRRRIGINGYASIIKFHTVQGFVRGFGYRMDKKCRTIGYCNLNLFIDKNTGREINISDDKGLNKEGKHVNMYPAKIVLTEKNTIERFEKFELEFEMEYRAKYGQMIMGG